MRSAFIPRDEKSEEENGIAQKETCREGNGEAKSLPKRTVGSRVREGRDQREVLRGKSATVAAAVHGSGKTGRGDAERAVCRNVAVLSNDVAFDSRLLRSQIPRRSGKHARRDYRCHHLYR